MKSPFEVNSHLVKSKKLVRNNIFEDKMRLLMTSTDEKDDGKYHNNKVKNLK